VTLDRGDAEVGMTRVRLAQRLRVILSPEEVAQLLDAAPGLKAKAALSLAYGAGLRASEVVSLKVSDIDSARQVIRVEQGPMGLRGAAKTVMPCCRTICSICCAPGGGPGARRASCCRAAGCSRVRTRSTP